MDIYFSYSTKVKPSRANNTEIDITLLKQAVQFVKENHKDVYFITDINGANLVKDINFKQVSLTLDNVPEKYKDVWSIGKLYAIRHIAQKQKPFIHIDNDFYLTQKLPTRIREAKIVVQSIEYQPNKLGYNIDKYNKYCINKYLASDINSDISYNCGIIGGTDYDFFYEFADTAIKMIEDPANEKLWLKKHLGFKPQTKATLAEQYYLACILKKRNIEPELFFDNAYGKLDNSEEFNYRPNDNRFFDETGGIHFFGLWKKFEMYKHKTGKWPNRFVRFLIEHL